MGYFGNGFVFSQEPNWSLLSDLPAELGLTGYSHTSKSLWLLDVWKCARHSHWHFGDQIGVGQHHLAPVPVEAEANLATFARICEAISHADLSEDIYGSVELHLTALLSHRLHASVFFFQGDDESSDMAATAVDGLFAEYRVRMGLYSVSFREGTFEVTPRTFAEDPEFSYSEDVLNEIATIPGVRVAQPVVIEAGETLYGNAVALWPADAGNPAKVLGIGTWDPFDNIERDYAQVFSRVCPPKEQKGLPTKPRAQPSPRNETRPWWRFWS